MNVNQLNPDTLKLIDLPEEILKTICHNLTIPALNALQKLSKQFHQIANDPLLWEKFMEKHEIKSFQNSIPSDKKTDPKKELELFFKHQLEKPEMALHTHVARIIRLVALESMNSFCTQSILKDKVCLLGKSPAIVCDLKSPGKINIKKRLFSMHFKRHSKAVA